MDDDIEVIYWTFVDRKINVIIVRPVVNKSLNLSKQNINKY